MKTKRKAIAIYILALSFLVAGCGPGQVFGPTITPTPTITLTPTSTPIPTMTPIPTSTNTPTPTPTLHFPVTEGTQLPPDRVSITVGNFNQLTQLASWGQGQILDSAISPDKTTLAIAAEGGIYLYDIQSSSQIFHLTISSSPTILSYSTDGSMLAIGTLDGGVILLQVEKNNYSTRVIKDDVVLLTDTSYINITNVDFSPDGQFIAASVFYNEISGYRENTFIWRVIDGKQLLDAQFTSAYISAFSPNSSAVVLASRNENKIKIINLDDGSLLHELNAASLSAQIGFSPDGKVLAAASKNGVQVWRTSDYSKMTILSGIEFVFSPVGGILATDEGKGWIELWEMNQDGSYYSHKAEFKGHSPIVFSSKGNYLAVPLELPMNSFNKWTVFGKLQNGQLLIYSVNNGILVNTIQVVSSEDDPLKAKYPDEFKINYRFSIYSTIFSEDETLVYTTGSWILNDGNLVFRIWRLADGGLEKTITFPPVEANASIAFSPDSKMLASCGAFGLYLRDTEGGQILHTFMDDSAPCGYASTLMFSSDKKYICSVHGLKGDTRWICWDVETFTKRLDNSYLPVDASIYANSSHSVFSDDFISPNGNILARIWYGGWEGIDFYYTLENPARLIKRFDFYNEWEGGGRAPRNSVAYSPDGTLIAIGNPGIIQIWGILP